MGRSTIQQLIQRAKSLNQYNNSGVDNDSIWIDHFNSALVEMVDDLNLQETFTINYTKDVTTYDMPDDYYAMVMLIDSKNTQIPQKRNFNQVYPMGYWILDKGDKFQINITYNTNDTLTLLYERYPTVLELGNITTQKPEVPTAGETALCYLSIRNSLLNNNQLGQAQYYDGLYKSELANIRIAATRAKGG